jgi:hypothetical protein
VDQPLEVELKPIEDTHNRQTYDREVEDRLRRHVPASGRITGPYIPPKALRRENLYEEQV